jgi:hypothetical protein
VNGVQQTYTKACVILQDFAATTPNVGASTKVGNISAHGGAEISSAYVVYTRVIAQAADEGAATALARSVTVTATNGSIVASPDQVDSPQSLEIDFEIFTAPGTNLTLNSDTGNLEADHYAATLHLTAHVGDTSLSNVQGDVSEETGTGSIDIKLAGAGWTGSGMTASTQTGSISLSRPAMYQAAFTAQSGLGTASIDNQSATATAGAPATVTEGSGAPIVLKSAVGNVSVAAAM